MGKLAKYCGTMACCLQITRSPQRLISPISCSAKEKREELRQLLQHLDRKSQEGREGRQGHQPHHREGEGRREEDEEERIVTTQQLQPPTQRVPPQRSVPGRRQEGRESRRDFRSDYSSPLTRRKTITPPRGVCLRVTQSLNQRQVEETRRTRTFSLA